VWTTAHTALLAINLDAKDDGPVDIFLDLYIGSQPDAKLSVVWNGRVVEITPIRPDTPTTLTCSLGNHHRTGGASNILGLSIDKLFSPSQYGSSDTRTLGLALCKLALVQR